MDFKQLEMFVAVVEEGNFTKAAERVFRTQSAVSIALLKLEKEMGSPLLDRSNRNSYVLTEAGRLLFDYARRLLKLRDEALADLQAIQSIRRGQVRIGVHGVEGLHVLPPVLRAVNELYPGIKVEVSRKSWADMVRDLRAGSLTFAISSFLPQENGLTATVLSHGDVVLIVSPGHRLTRQSDVRLRDLSTESFIAYNRGSDWYQRVVDAFDRSQVRLNVIVTIDDLGAIKKLVSANLGIAFVPRACAEDELAHDELVALPVRGIDSEYTLWLVHHHIDSEAGRAFLRAVKQFRDDRIERRVHRGMLRFHQRSGGVRV